MLISCRYEETWMMIVCVLVDSCLIKSRSRMVKASNRKFLPHVKTPQQLRQTPLDDGRSNDYKTERRQQHGSFWYHVKAPTEHTIVTNFYWFTETMASHAFCAIWHAWQNKQKIRDANIVWSGLHVHGWSYQIEGKKWIENDMYLSFIKTWMLSKHFYGNLLIEC